MPQNTISQNSNREAELEYALITQRGIIGRLLCVKDTNTLNQELLNLNSDLFIDSKYKLIFEYIIKHIKENKSIPSYDLICKKINVTKDLLIHCLSNSDSASDKERISALKKTNTKLKLQS